MKKIIFIIFSLIVAVQISSAGHIFDPAVIRDGDIIFHETNFEQSRALKLVTKSRYTHAGIIFRINGQWKVLEAVQPVKYTDLSDFIRRGTNRHYAVKRLKNRDEVLTIETVEKMKTYGKTFLGRNYDIYFEWNDKRIYCTELIWKLYKKNTGIETGKLQRLGDLDLSHPFVIMLLNQRYGKKIPYDEPVITPASMFASDNLVTVVEEN